MLNVFIADDEAWVVESLKTSIPWNELGFRVVGQSLDGLDAYDRICKLMPEVVFTDIRMPGMNGLELIKNLNRLHLDTAFIVMTGFAEFAYAQKALNYGAAGFCLKPFDEEEIMGLLKKIKAARKIKRMGEGQDADFAVFVDEYGSGWKAELDKRCGSDCAAQSSLTAVLLLGDGNPEVRTGIRYSRFRAGMKKWLYFVCARDQELFLSEIKKSMNMEKSADRIIKSASFCSISDRSANTKILLDLLDTALYGFFTTGSSGIFPAADGGEEAFREIMEQLEDSVRRGDIHAVDGWLVDMGRKLAVGQLNIKCAVTLYNRVAYLVASKNSHGSPEYIYNYDAFAEQFGKAEHMIMRIRELVQGCIYCVTGDIPEDIDNQTFKAVLKHIHENFFMDISIQSLSVKFFISPNYISQLFKKCLGTTFTDYLSGIRIRYACKLLESEELHVNEVGLKAGYPDYFYFCRVFKKITGLTPSQYREEIKTRRTCR